MLYNVSKLHRELEASGIPIYGCDETGRVDFREEATQEQRDQAAAIVAAHDPTEPAVPTLEQQVADLRKVIIDMQLGVI